jgi:enamine deaminase RidA (YjgF/YER057c/UK114 family)
MSLPLRHLIAAAPRAPAPYSHAVEADGFVFVTGQMPNDPADPEAPLPAGIEAQARQVVANLKLVLGELGLGLEHALMARIYLSEFRRDYAALNRLWPALWPEGLLPARTTTGVTALSLDALVEIDLVAKRP